MFSKKQRREPVIGTLIGSATRVHGDLEFTGGCLIDGYVMGNVQSVGDADSLLSVSERGCVEGAIEVPNVLLNGTVKGDVRAVKRVELGPRAQVHGNVAYGLIEMAIGAQVNGKLLHTSEPEALPAAAPGPEASRPDADQEGPALDGTTVYGEST